MIRQVKRILTVLTVLSLLMTPAVLNVEAVAITLDEFGNYPQTGRFYMFQNVHSGKFLEIADGNVTSGANVWQDTFEYDTNRSQVFRILKPESTDIGGGNPNTSEYHQIKSGVDATLRLDVVNAADQDGTNIGLFQYNPGYGAQSFRFIDNGDGSVRIEPYLSRGSKRVLTVVNASTSNKANVVLSAWTGDTSQRWVIKEFDLDTYPELIGLNWSYFFRNSDSNKRTASQRIRLGGSRLHVGMDLIADTGTPLYSPCSGKVLQAGDEETMGYYVIFETTAKIYGNTKKLTVRMMHMKQFPSVAVGDTITKNTLLGYVGNTGDSEGPHLHVDINTEGHTGGNAIRSDLTSVIDPEKLFLSKRFKYQQNDGSEPYATVVQDLEWASEQD